MSLRKEERKTDLEIKEYLDSFSPSLCMAKWYNATIWLGSGQTTSCHHPLPHQISVDEIKIRPSAIHNTSQKKQERAMMQEGDRPKGCQYCWKIEDMGPEYISDRVYKSVLYNDEDVEYAAKADPNADINLKTLEIAFDRTCNYACSYCNPAFSSEWAKDIKTAGPYVQLRSDGRNHFTHEHNEAQPYKLEETNPYVEAFFKWWESDLHRTLHELRLTGGEPLMSPHTWRLFDWFLENGTDMRFAVNSNLGAKDSLIDKLIATSHSIKDFHVYTSNESMHGQAEYIRDGLNWHQWFGNIYRLLDEGSVQGLHMMCTINALCLDTLPEFLDEMMKLKAEYGNDYPVFTLNILRFPSFQSPLVLPDDIREEYRQGLVRWLNNNEDSHLLHDMEVNQMERLIDYLDIVKTPHDDAFDRPALLNDFHQFYKQYDERRGKNFQDTFPNLAEWYNSLAPKT